MTAATYHLMAMCPECGQAQSTGIRLAPGDQASVTGFLTGCKSCGDLFEVPDGDYGVIDGAVSWLRGFTSPESRKALAEALAEARDALISGAEPAAASNLIEARTGLGLWSYLKTEDGKALLTVINLLLVLLTFVGLEPNQADEKPAPQPDVRIEQHIEIDDRDEITIVLPGKSTDQPRR